MAPDLHAAARTAEANGDYARPVSSVAAEFGMELAHASPSRRARRPRRGGVPEEPPSGTVHGVDETLRPQDRGLWTKSSRLLLAGDLPCPHCQSRCGRAVRPRPTAPRPVAPARASPS